jgi:hypothetical protein
MWRREAVREVVATRERGFVRSLQPGAVGVVAGAGAAGAVAGGGDAGGGSSVANAGALADSRHTASAATGMYRLIMRSWKSLPGGASSAIAVQPKGAGNRSVTAFD